MNHDPLAIEDAAECIDDGAAARAVRSDDGDLLPGRALALPSNSSPSLFPSPASGRYKGESFINTGFLLFVGQVYVEGHTCSG